MSPCDGGGDKPKPIDDETEAFVKEWLAAIARGECPTHKRVVKRHQVGRCVYGDCGCRLYQGELLREKARR